MMVWMQRLRSALKLPPSYSSEPLGSPCKDKANPFEIKSTADSLGSIRAFFTFKIEMVLQRGLALMHSQMQACSPVLAPFALCQPLNQQSMFREEE